MTAQGGDALARADAVLRQHGKTFAWARRFLGERHARRATELYAFCRYLDDVADEGDDPAAAARALQQVRRDLDRGASDDPFVAAVLAQFGERVAGREAAKALVDGVLYQANLAHALVVEPTERLEALLWFAERVEESAPAFAACVWTTCGSNSSRTRRTLR